MCGLLMSHTILAGLEITHALTSVFHWSAVSAHAQELHVSGSQAQVFLRRALYEHSCGRGLDNFKQCPLNPHSTCYRPTFDEIVATLTSLVKEHAAIVNVAAKAVQPPAATARSQPKPEARPQQSPPAQDRPPPLPIPASGRSFVFLGRNKTFGALGRRSASLSLAAHSHLPHTCVHCYRCNLFAVTVFPGYKCSPEVAPTSRVQ